MAFLAIVVVTIAVRKEEQKIATADPANRTTSKSSLAYLTPAAFTLVGLFAVFLVFAVALAMPSKQGQLQKVGEQIQSKYGLELDREELAKLDYPTEKPATDFRAFGSIHQIAPTADGLAKREVALIWENDEFYLAESLDEDNFQEISSR